MTEYTRLRPHWRPTHDANPTGFDRWIGPDGSNGWVKILNPDGHLVRRVWEVAPQARICLRLHALSEMKAELLSDPHELGIDHAVEWQVWLHANSLTQQAHNNLTDQVHAGQLVMEGINEPEIWEAPVALAHNIYAGSFGKEMRARSQTAVIGNINTGHPPNHDTDTVKGTPVDWTPLLATLHAIRIYGHILGLHEYCDARGPASPDWGWNMGRFTQLPREFTNLPILFTEVGYDRAVNAPAGTGNHGWAGELDPAIYLSYLMEYDRRLRAYPNILAAFVFTHDWDAPWGTWDTRPLLDGLCDHAEQVRRQPSGILIPTPLIGPTPPSAQPPPPPGIIDPAALEAILEVESNGAGFVNQRMVIRFEAHIFVREHGSTPHFRYNDAGRPWLEQFWRPTPAFAWRAIHTGHQDSEWAAFEFARSLNETAAMRSISMGAPQIMGFNHQRIGYATPQAMFSAFDDSYPAQLIGLINFILSDAVLVAAIRQRDWRTVAKLYNGPGQVEVYALRMEKAYREASA